MEMPEGPEYRCYLPSWFGCSLGGSGVDPAMRQAKGMQGRSGQAGQKVRAELTARGAKIQS